MTNDRDTLRLDRIAIITGELTDELGPIETKKSDAKPGHCWEKSLRI